MRTLICNILLIILLLQATTHHGFSADETPKVGSLKALATYDIWIPEALWAENGLS